MNWKVQFTAKARKDLRRFAVGDQRRIADFLYERVSKHADPRRLAKRLSGVDIALWRFRLGAFAS